MLQVIPKNHPRYHSLQVRHTLERGIKQGIVTPTGLIAHGRGEAFDYLIGEKTPKPSYRAIEAACALLLLAKHPVISINGNTAMLVPHEVVILSHIVPAALEINIFYPPVRRKKHIASFLKKHGATKIYGVNPALEIPSISSLRSQVSKEGIHKADVVLLALEDGDRTAVLMKMKKKVIAIDLNPLSRTAQTASITIVDNVVRCLPYMVKQLHFLKKKKEPELRALVDAFNNKKYLHSIFLFIQNRFKKLAYSAT